MRLCHILHLLFCFALFYQMSFPAFPFSTSLSFDDDAANDDDLPPNFELLEPKPTPKLIRVLIVLAYVLSVSMVAIVLSIYYLFVWDEQITHTKNVTDDVTIADEIQAYETIALNDFYTTYEKNIKIYRHARNPTATHVENTLDNFEATGTNEVREVIPTSTIEIFDKVETTLSSNTTFNDSSILEIYQDVNVSTSDFNIGVEDEFIRNSISNSSDLELYQDFNVSTGPFGIGVEDEFNRNPTSSNSSDLDLYQDFIGSTTANQVQTAMDDFDLVNITTVSA